MPSALRPPKPAHLAAALLCTALAAASHAAGEQAALKGTNLSRFNADDLALMKARVGQALTSGAEGEALQWKNDKSRASGSVTPLGRESWRGLNCRRLRIVNTIGTSSRQGVYRFCERPAGQWKLAGPVPDAPPAPR